MVKQYVYEGEKLKVCPYQYYTCHDNSSCSVFESLKGIDDPQEWKKRALNAGSCKNRGLNLKEEVVQC